MSKKQSIIVAEDEAIISDTLISELSENGLDVTLARDGQDAWEKIQEMKPSVVVLDLIMPKLNGFEVLQKISESKTLKKVPVIILSNLGQESDISECERLGAKEYLIKSNTPIETIVGTIKKYL